MVAEKKPKPVLIVKPPPKGSGDLAMRAFAKKVREALRPQKAPDSHPGP